MAVFSTTHLLLLFALRHTYFICIAGTNGPLLPVRVWDRRPKDDITSVLVTR